jgi:hypothetical protein
MEGVLRLHLGLHRDDHSPSHRLPSSSCSSFAFSAFSYLSRGLDYNVGDDHDTIYPILARVLGDHVRRTGRQAELQISISCIYIGKGGATFFYSSSRLPCFTLGIHPSSPLRLSHPFGHCPSENCQVKSPLVSFANTSPIIRVRLALSRPTLRSKISVLRIAICGQPLSRRVGIEVL